MGLFKKMMISSVLLFLSGWVIWYGTAFRSMENRNEAQAADRRTRIIFPRALYNDGISALHSNNPAKAAICFQQAVSKNILYMNAWLKLAQAELQLDHRETAVQILKFSDQVTQNTIKWKWPQILLANELAEVDIFLKNINYAVSHPQLRKDALFLIERFYNSNTGQVMEGLQSENLPFYLEWLMKWGRTEDARKVWRKMAESEKVADRLYERYVRFLIRQVEIQKAAEVWETYTGISGISNPGFENQVPGKVFDWNTLNQKNDHWHIRRMRSEPKSGEYAAEVSFFGSANTNFSHLGQVVPVLPGKSYCLTFWWRSKNLTTDQRPFIEISGYRCKSPIFKNNMIVSDSNWHEQSINFTVPEICEAVNIRLRRLPSHKFDCKIKGSVWLDDFKLEEVRSGEEEPFHSS